MPSRFQIREAVVKFLYCSDLEGGIDLVSLREHSWSFVNESDRHILELEMFRNIKHIALDYRREGPLADFHKRQNLACTLLSAYPDAEQLRLDLDRIAKLETEWSDQFAKLERLPKDEYEATEEESFGDTLHALLGVDRELAATRRRFLESTEDFPALGKQLEAVAASIRRFQRVSDLLRMIEDPESFPEQANLARLRYSKTKIRTLRKKADELVDSILARKDRIDEVINAKVENFSPERIDPVDRAILRLATHEILHAGTPSKVAINEAVELAKRFGTGDSGRFVNGVLDRIARQVDAQHEIT